MGAEVTRFRAMSRAEFYAFLEGIGKTMVDGRPVEASRTAFITAFIRAYHSANEVSKVFDDWMAAQLLTAEEYAFFEEMYYRRTLRDNPQASRRPDQRRSVVTAAMRGGVAGSILSRARFAEEALEKAIAEGVEQYVLLGAGLDTFALRRPDLLQRIRVIEVDLPATQVVKRQRLAALGFSPPPTLHFVAVDFSREELPQALARSCLRAEIPAFFSWLGVTYYLERENLFQVLRTLSEAAAPHSLLAFDYMDRAAFDPARAAPQAQKLQDKVRLLGEPMKTGLDPLGLEEDLRELGWKLQQDLASQDLEEAYFRGCAAELRPGEYLHLALAALPDRAAIHGS